MGLSRRLIRAAAAALVFLFCLAPGAYAYETGSLLPEEGGIRDGIRVWQEEIRALHEAALTAGLGLAAVCAAVCAVKYLVSSEQEAARSLRRAVWAVLALAALYLLPLVTSAAIGIFGKYAWDPSAGIGLNGLAPVGESLTDPED